MTTKFGQHGANVLFVDKQYISILHKRSIEIIKTRRIRMTYYEKIVTAIKTREVLEMPLLSLGLILKTGGIEAAGYLGMCSDRLAEAELIDGEDVRIDFINFPDLLLSADGVRTCRGILENYVSDDIISDAFEALCHEESIRAEISMFSGTLRELGTAGLVKMYARCKDNQIRKLIAAEAYHRSILSSIIRRLRSLFYDVLVHVKYHRLISVVDMAVKNIRSETK